MLTIKYGKYKRRAYATLLTLWLLSTEIAATFLLNFVETPWKRKNIDSIEKSDFIVVLSGGRKILVPGQNKTYEWTDPDRFLAGLDLYKKDKAPKILFTGGLNPYIPEKFTEGELYVKEAIDMGVNPNDVKTTKGVTNTFEESVMVKKYVEKISIKISPKIILVTSAFHMNRAKKLFERQGLKVIAYPVDFKSQLKPTSYFFKSPSAIIPNADSLSLSSKAIRELIGRLFYRTWLK